MTYLTDLGPDYDAGLEFNYDVWTPNTTITLCNVPWSADYRDIVYYSSTNDLIKYLNKTTGPTTTYQGSTLVIPGKPIMLDIPVNQAYRYNYIHVHNPAMPGQWANNIQDVPRDFFYFISDVQYVAPNTTALHVQLDVWQSFGRYVEFGQCYIERGHIGIANKNQLENRGRDYLTVPEGLDTGNEYQISDTFWREIATSKRRNYSVMVWSNTSLHSNPGTREKPSLTVASGSQFEQLPNSVNIYMFDLDSWINAVNVLSLFPWITQGIISVMAVPDDVIPENYFTGSQVTIASTQSSVSCMLVTGSGDIQGKSTPINIWDDKLWRDVIQDKIPEEFRILHKFETYPYCFFELTTNNGTPIIIKPECMGSDNFTVMQYVHLAPPSPRIMYTVKYYNRGPHAPTLGYDDIEDNPLFSGGEDMDMMTGISNFPTFSILNNSYTQYMASNANSLAYAHQSADWSRNRSIAGAQAGYDVTTNQMGASTAATNQNNSAMMRHVMVQNDTIAAQNNLTNDQLVQHQLLGIAQGLGNGAASGGLGGAIMGAVGGIGNAIGTGITINGNNQAAAISQSANGRSNAISMANNTALNNISNNATAYARDTNFAYANYAANGDYQNAIAGINAKTQDAKLMQPTTSGQVGGDAFNLATTGWYLTCKLKTLDPAAMRIIGTYWLRYGYAINRFGKLPANFACMSKFTYWKLRETYISSSQCPEVFKNTIRGIFEKGVTVWRHATDIGKITIYDNSPLGGITYE